MKKLLKIVAILLPLGTFGISTSVFAEEGDIGYVSIGAAKTSYKW